MKILRKKKKITKIDESKIATLGIYFYDDKNLKSLPKISKVEEDGPSYEFIKINDLILEINKKKIKTIKDFDIQIKKIKPNEIVMLRLLRRGQELNRPIRVISLDEYKNPKLKQKVKLGIFFSPPGNQDLMILSVAKKSPCFRKLKAGDVILELNDVKLEKRDDYYRELGKVLWGQVVKVKVLRRSKKKADKLQKLSFKIKTSSLIEYREKIIVVGINFSIFKKKYLKITNVFPCSSSDGLLKKKDILLNLITEVEGVKKKIKLVPKFDLENYLIENFEPTQRIKFEIYRNSKKEIIEIKLISYHEYNLARREKIRMNLSKPRADFYIRELENSEDYSITPALSDQIVAMDLEIEKEIDDDYEKIFISTSIKKEKVLGKDSFVVYFNDFPSLFSFENNETYLKIYAFDVTDLDQKEYEDIYYEDEEYEYNPKLINYLKNNCHIIKTNNIGWSEGNDNLVQSKLLNTDEDPPEKIAFPFSVMNFPKAGKRKIAFRTFICTKELKFDEKEGRPLNSYNEVNYAPEHFKLHPYNEIFDEYNQFPEILAYDVAEIEAEYKQPGYLGVNRQKLDALIIPLGFHVAQIKNDLEKSFKIIKDKIEYKGDRSLEGGINQVINLKKYYDLSKSSKIKPDDYLKSIKNFAKIDERYEVINLLLNIATDDQTLTATENKFIDHVADKLGLNQNKYLEIKKIETASLKFVDFGDKADESIFGLTNEMDTKEKCTLLRKEYSRWNSQTNNNDKMKRDRAKEMVKLIANLRKQYNC